MRGRYAMHIAQAQLVKLGQLLAIGHAFGLVGSQNAGLAQAAQVIGNVVILRRQAVARIDYKDHHVGLGYGLPRLVRHFAVDAAFACIGLEAAGIDHDELAAAQAARAIVAVAGQARVIGHDGIACFGQAVEQGRFADIGAPNEGDDRFHLDTGRLLSGMR